ncbi:MAG: SpoIIE family protein phosphatase, partial [Eubacteriales bacterium]
LAAGSAAVAWATYQAGFDGLAEVLPPVTAACAVLIPLYRYGLIRLPEELFGGALRRTSPADGMTARSRDEMGRRISQMSDSLASVSAILYGMSERLSRPGKPELREICETSFGMYCRTCAIRSKCHEARVSKTAPVIAAMTNELARDGTASAGTVPASLASHCFNIGRIIDEINRTAGARAARMKSNDKLSVAAADFGLAGELMKTAFHAGESVAKVDGELSKKLRRLLACNDFRAGSVTAYGERMKYIFVRDVDLSTTRMGGDDLRKLFEEMAGIRLSQPEFTLDGAVLSMTMHSVCSFACLSGRATCAASSVHKYWGDLRGCGADCVGDDSETDGACGGIHAEGDGPAEPVRGENEGEYENEDGRRTAGRRTVEVTEEEPETGEVCGDAIVSFETAGKYYMLISDGMGSGREAALTSGVCATLLQRLIESGAGLETALKMLNNILCAGERECSATVDIAEIDLITGEARFVKSGAAPSFVLRDGSIFRLQSKTIPIGILRAIDAEMIRFDVRPGDRVVMVSDGAARSYDEVPWLLDMMTSDEVILNGSPREAAARIVREAARRGASDDITAGVICVAGGL